MGFPIATTVGAASAVASTFAAIASWLAARKANAASEQANLTAEVVAGIERDRRHAELRPLLEVSPPAAANDPDVLRFRFSGPDELEPLGPLTMVVTIRDDRDRSNDAVLGAGPSREEVAACIWGPWRLRPGVDDADQSGRFTQPRTVAVGEELWSSIDRSPAPRWYGGGQTAWDQHYDQEAIRLRVEVTVAGFQPWVFLREIEPWRGRGVHFVIESGSGSSYLLRNTGPNEATGVTVADHAAISDRPDGVSVGPNDAVQMHIEGSMGVTMPTSLRVTWDGQSRPVSVAIPPI